MKTEHQFFERWKCAIAVLVLCLFCATSNCEKLRKVRKIKKGGRFLSKPLGFILGNESCRTSLGDRNVTGICYNEMECILKGGIISGYCSGGPPILTGACCVFESRSCEDKITERTTYFKNKSYPRDDIKPYQCLLDIRAQSDTCWVKQLFDFKFGLI